MSLRLCSSRPISSSICGRAFRTHIQLLHPTPQSRRRSMAATSRAASTLSHEERTADSQRDSSSHLVTIARIAQINPTIRVLHLSPVDKSKPVNFLPGQWLDVFVPDVPKAGGFTVTSTPAAAAPNASAQPGEQQHLEIAVQKSPKNPPAAWLWRPESQVLGANLTVRVGGDFVWPPRLHGQAGADEWNRAPPEQRSIVMVAGGVGINPLISMIAHIHEQAHPIRSLTLLYATKAATKPDGSDILFLPRIKALATNSASRVRLFITAAPPSPPADADTDADARQGESTPMHAPLQLDDAAVGLPLHRRRIELADVERALPTAAARGAAVCYICGPKAFTDTFVDAVGGLEGMHADRVLCERWW